MTTTEYVHGALSRVGIPPNLHLIPAATDPQRNPRDPRAALRTLTRYGPSDWHDFLLETLADGTPRTFNGLGLAMLDLTVDLVAETSLESALWNLVALGKIEHTTTAPIFYRLRDRRAVSTASSHPQLPLSLELPAADRFTTK